MRNVVLVTCDSLRAENTSVYGYDRDTTPFLETLAEDALLAENAFSAGPASFSMSGTLTSTIPLTEGAYYSIPDHLPSVAEALPEEYTCIGVHSNAFFVEENGYHRGFDKLVDAGNQIDNEEENERQGLKDSIEELLSHSDILHSIGQHVYRRYKIRNAALDDPRVPGPRINEIAYDLLESADTPIFLWVHYMDTHSPFIPDFDILSSFASGITREDVAELVVYRNANDKVTHDDDRTQRLLDVYDAEIRRADSIIEEFLESITANSLVDHPVTIVSADHGEAFGEHEWLGHQPGALYDETLRVPMIVHDPQDDVDMGSIRNPVSTIDIPPTVCELAGCRHPETFQGQSLLNEGARNEREGVFSLAAHDEKSRVLRENLGIRYRTRDWAYIYRERGSDELYRASDPGEEILAENPGVAKELLGEISNVIDSIFLDDSTGLSVDDDTRERLAELGYVD